MSPSHIVWAATGKERTLRNETVKKVGLVNAENCIGSLNSGNVVSKARHGCRLVDGFYGQTMKLFGSALAKAFQENLRMSRLTRRKAGRSDNNEAGEASWFDASMA
jgi:hypothetical protein